jgi:hypothetical protein
MKSSDLTGAVWRKSSRSNGQMECVEVARLDDGRVAMRDSKDNGQGQALIFTAREWRAFKGAAVDDQF